MKPLNSLVSIVGNAESHFAWQSDARASGSGGRNADDTRSPAQKEVDKVYVMMSQ